MRFTILHFETLESTNDEVIRQARSGAPEGLCVIARSQTKGRGRYGRSWSSPPDAGLYLSLLLRPSIKTEFFPLITLMSAVAVHDTLETLYSLECDIKWVNDIYVRQRKICGILSEAVETEYGNTVIVGIGINLLRSIISQEISEIATSIEAETNMKPNKDLLIKRLLEQIDSLYELLKGQNGDEKIRSEWIKRSSYAFGKRVKVKLEKEILYGVTEGIGENGALILRLDSGDIRSISTGDVQQLRES